MLICCACWAYCTKDKVTIKHLSPCWKRPWRNAERGLLGLRDHHPATLESMNNLALLYFEQGKFHATESLCMECLEKRKPTLGGDHPDTLLAIDNLAGLCASQGNYDAAEPLMVECVEKRKATVGPDHPTTLRSINNLALLYDYTWYVWRRRKRLLMMITSILLFP